MHPTSTPYTSYQSTYKTRPTYSGVNWAELKIEAGNLTHDDIPVFSFAPLDHIREDLAQAGYTQEEVESTIAGLSELPEYADSKRNKKSRK